MKTKILLAFLVFITNYTSVFAQSGSDFIITIDNSGSIQQQDFDDISNNAKKIIDQILRCNHENRVSVVHYGTGLLNSSYTGNESPKIYIESDFTNDITVAQNFTRKLTFGDHYHEAVGLIGNALDNVSNTNILSPQQNLNHNPNVPLVIISFTDANRASGSLQGGSYLVNYFNPNFNSQFAFQNFIDFKINRDVKFIIIHRPPPQDNASIFAAAGISSNGGSYIGNLENYQGDPEFGNTPKFYYQQSDFVYQQSVADEILHDFCKFDGYVKFFYEKQQDCTNPSDPAYGSVHFGKFVLPYGGTYQYMKLFAVNTATNAEIQVNYNPILTGNTFWYQIQPNDIVPTPTTGAYKLRLDLTYDYGGSSKTISSWNNYPDSYFGGSDIFYGSSCKNSQSIKDNIKLDIGNEKIDKNADPNNLKQNFSINKNLFKLSPNPTTGIINITLDESTSGRLDITDSNGINIYTELFKNKKSINLDIQSRINGLYLVTITNDKGEIFTKKVLKN